MKTLNKDAYRKFLADYYFELQAASGKVRARSENAGWNGLLTSISKMPSPLKETAFVDAVLNNHAFVKAA